MNKQRLNDLNYKLNKSYEEKVELRSLLLERKTELENQIRNCHEAVPHDVVDEYQDVVNKLLHLV